MPFLHLKFKFKFQIIVIDGRFDSYNHKTWQYDYHFWCILNLNLNFKYDSLIASLIDALSIYANNDYHFYCNINLILSFII